VKPRSVEILTADSGRGRIERSSSPRVRRTVHVDSSENLRSYRRDHNPGRKSLRHNSHHRRYGNSSYYHKGSHHGHYDHHDYHGHHGYHSGWRYGIGLHFPIVRHVKVYHRPSYVSYGSPGYYYDCGDYDYGAYDDYGTASVSFNNVGYADEGYYDDSYAEGYYDTGNYSYLGGGYAGSNWSFHGYWKSICTPYTYHRSVYYWDRFRNYWTYDYWPNTLYGSLWLSFKF
jgi:hypothetical protein